MNFKVVIGRVYGNVLPPGFEPGFLDRKSKVLSNTFPYLLTGLDDRSLYKEAFWNSYKGFETIHKTLIRSNLLRYDFLLVTMKYAFLVLCTVLLASFSHASKTMDDPEKKDVIVWFNDPASVERFLKNTGDDFALRYRYENALGLFHKRIDRCILSYNLGKIGLK